MKETAQKNEITAIRGAVDAAFKQLANNVPELGLAILATGDGHLLTGYFAKPRNGARLSALVSSLLAICETVSKELSAGACKSAIVAADELHIIVVRVGHMAKPLVMAAAYDAEMMLGAALRHTTGVAAEVASIIKTVRENPQ